VNICVVKTVMIDSITSYVLSANVTLKVQKVVKYLKHLEI